MSMKPAGGRQNRLVNESSPYLLQHASNPVDWFPWGTEAFEKARLEDKPIFLSIGYSTCHWCHVMERESFENERVAEFLGRHFVSIKVDREERPEVDEIYMTALTHVFGRGGGWPLSMWLTPDLKPIFGGTYFPPDDRYGQPGFLSLLAKIQEAWTQQRETLTRDSEEICRALASISQSTSPGELAADAFVAAFSPVKERFDPIFGGLGQAPKFPQPSLIQYLLRAHLRIAAPGISTSEPLSLALLQLRNMARGGIYDQLGGGFARYSTDERWLAPHFEKMLYDNAQLLRVYAEAYQLNADPLFESTIRDTAAYALRDLAHADGGFYSAEDADSEGVEGKFYVWRESELAEVLGQGEDLDLFCRAYDVTETGNWADPHHDTAGLNILNLKLSAEDLSEETGLSTGEVEKSLEKSRAALLKARGRRVRPGRDEKVLVGWNGLMIAGLSKASRALGDDALADAAVRAAGFVLERLKRDPASGATVESAPRPSLARSWKDGDLRGEAGLEDYAYFVDGLIELYQATLDPAWITTARDLHEESLGLFYDPVHGGFWSSAPGRGDLITRHKSVDDGALPSAAGVSALNSLRLGQIFDRTDWIDVAEETLKTYAGMMKKHPVGVTTLLIALDWLMDGGRQVVLAGETENARGLELRRVLDRSFHPRMLVLSSARRDGHETLPLAEGKVPVDGQVAAYLCENRTCRTPLVSAQELAEAIR